MHIKLALPALWALVTSASFIPRSSKIRCGTAEPSAELLASANLFAAQEKDMAVSSNLTTQAAIGIQTYFHVIASSTSLEDGYLTQDLLDAQISAMNEHYGPSGVSFTLAGADWTVNSDWAAFRDQDGMKQALRRGAYADLNVYFLRDMGSLLGECTFPTTAGEGSAAFLEDGCTVLAQSVPGGSAAPYNEGKTATHEVGHWLGLFHTFQGGCSEPGDEVADTPAEAMPTFGCPEGQDSCSSAGVDPIHNYMDYTDDACMTEFTAGQATRIDSMWTAYRSGR